MKPVMKRIAKTLLTGLSLAWLAGSCTSNPAQAQIPSELQNPNVRVDYVEPRPPEDPLSATYAKDKAAYERYMKIYERMRNRQVLEQFGQFLAPLKLPRILRVSVEPCGTVNAFYDGDHWRIIMCYEIIDTIELMAPKTTSPEGITRAEAIIGGFVGILLHEGGHAVSDLFRLPVLGREEDSADDISAFIMLQFGEEVARTAIKGTVYIWLKLSEGGGGIYWDTHSTSAQRYANYLCMAYGRDPQVFKELADQWLSPERAPNCAHEYQQTLNAFNKTIRPHVDEALMQKIRQAPMFRPGDGEW
jgi:hypothetical protein